MIVLTVNTSYFCRKVMIISEVLNYFCVINVIKFYILSFCALSTFTIIIFYFEMNVGVN